MKNKNKDIRPVLVAVFCALVIALIIWQIINFNNIYLTVITILSLYIFAMYSLIKEIKNRKTNIEAVKKGVELALKKNLNAFNLPICFVSLKGRVIWKNLECQEMLNEHDITEVYNNYVSTEKNEDFDISKLVYNLKASNNRSYECNYSNSKFKNIEYIIISFIDTTKQNELEDRLKDNNLNVAVITIDNYEETFSGISEIDKLEIVTKIDKKIRNYVDELEGIVAKLEKDKYICCLKQYRLNELEANEFKILEEVKEISDKTKLPITISIGISGLEDTLADKYSAAINALEIAQGRGGNQAIIKRNKKYDFYGELNEDLEKTSRVKARSVATAFKDIVFKSDNIYIVGHKNPDPDSIGAGIGIAKIAKTYGKEVKIVIDTKLNNTTKIILEKLENNDEYKDIFMTKEELKKKKIMIDDLLVIVDTHKKSYLASGNVASEFTNVVMIDHHRRGPEFIEDTLLTYHEIYASSTCELVTELIMHMEDIKISNIEAELLYAGILIDTKNFSYKTGVRTFEVAAYLKSIGIDISEVKQLFQNDFDTYLAKAEIIKNAELIDDKIAISICNKEHEDKATLIAQAADELLSINSILVSFVLCENDGVILISSRSTGDINVQYIMEELGGGGHLTFAGAQLENVTIDEAKEKLIEIIKKHIIKD